MPRLVISYPVGCPPGPSAVSAISLDTDVVTPVAPILLRAPVFLLCKVDGGTIGNAGGVEKVVVVVVLTVATHAVILCSNMESS